MKGTIGVRLALWYAGVFVSSVGVLVLITYALLASSLRQRDQELVVSTLRDYAQRYEAGGLGAVVQAVEAEQRAGTRERLFVRVLGRGQDLLFATIPPEWGSFDVDYLGNELAHVDRGLYGANAHYASDSITRFGERKIGMPANMPCAMAIVVKKPAGISPV